MTGSRRRAGGRPAQGRWSVEAATREDVAQITALLAELFTIESDFEADVARQTRGLKLLLARPARARVLVARADGRVIGTASAQLAVSTSEGAWSAWIEDVIVARDWRGCGVGRALLADLLGWARRRGATRAQLLVDLDNQPAERFYARLGWRPTRLGVRRLMLAG